MPYMTTAQALVRFLDNQYVSLDGKETKFVEGIFTIFGHGIVCGLGEALDSNRGGLTVFQGKNEQGMAHAATAFAKQTLLGAAKLLEASGEEPATMRKQVTSKKGTTEAAILTMTENNFYEAVKQGMAAAHRRTLELGNIKNN